MWSIAGDEMPFKYNLASLISQDQVILTKATGDVHRYLLIPGRIWPYYDFISLSIRKLYNYYVRKLPSSIEIYLFKSVVAIFSKRLVR